MGQLNLLSETGASGSPPKRITFNETIDDSVSETKGADKTKDTTVSITPQRQYYGHGGGQMLTDEVKDELKKEIKEEVR